MYVVVSKQTGLAVWEFWNKAIIWKINIDLYTVMKVSDYLAMLNHQTAQ